MYEYIKGLFVGLNKDCIIIDNNGIGYKIYTSGSTIASMPKSNETVCLYLHQIVREDFIGLYGFLSKEELDMFLLLLTINGVGAKAALSLLSISTVSNLKYAIATGDEKTITKAPGIGRKIAQRIILELKEKLQGEGMEGALISEESIVDHKVSSEVLEALLALGYSEKEAQSALKKVEERESLESTIKECLKYLMN